MKTKIFIIFLTVFTLQTFSQVNVKSVSVFGDYSFAPTKKEFLKIDKVYGYGGGAKIDVALNSFLSIQLTGGYNEFVVEQEEHALFLEWNWRSWKRYYGDINDSNFSRATQWVQSILKDSNYKATFEPVQRMDYFPVIFSLAFNVKPDKNFEISQSIGFGMVFYSRRLYVNENWSKKFATLNNYIYSYSYRNNAETITGNPLVLTAGMDLNYSISELISVFGSINYVHILETPNKYGYDDFPSKNLLNVKLGISFLY